jgi:hypothetical protein
MNTNLCRLSFTMESLEERAGLSSVPLIIYLAVGYLANLFTAPSKRSGHRKASPASQPEYCMGSHLIKSLRFHDRAATMVFCRCAYKPLDP